MHNFVFSKLTHNKNWNVWNKFKW